MVKTKFAQLVDGLRCGIHTSQGMKRMGGRKTGLDRGSDRVWDFRSNWRGFKLNLTQMVFRTSWICYLQQRGFGEIWKIRKRKVMRCVWQTNYRFRLNPLFRESDSSGRGFAWGNKKIGKRRGMKGKKHYIWQSNYNFRLDPLFGESVSSGRGLVGGNEEGEEDRKDLVHLEHWSNEREARKRREGATRVKVFNWEKKREGFDVVPAWVWMSLRFFEWIWGPISFGGGYFSDRDWTR